MSDEKILNNVVMDGKPDVATMRRSEIKMQASNPHITVVMPVGNKEVGAVVPCPSCKKELIVSDGKRVPGLVPIQWAIQHMNWVPPLNVAMAYLVKYNMQSAEARQVMTMEALRLGTKYLFYIDDDVIIPPKGLYMLHNFMERHPEAGAVTGVYTTREDPPEPLIYKNHGEGCSWDFEMGPGAVPEQIFGCGAGCILVRAQAIIDWIEQNPDLPVWADERSIHVAEKGENKEDNNRTMWGHDIRFTKNLTEADWPVFVDGKVLCGHLDMQTGMVSQVPDDAPGFKIRGK